MFRLFSLIIVLLLTLPTPAQVPASRANDSQSQNPAPPDTSSEEVPRYSVPQNLPCVGQPRSRKELAASFRRARFPLASQIAGTWVAIGLVDNYPSDEDVSLNCSGVKRGSKFEFVLVASDHSVELHAIGIDIAQKVTLEPDRKGSIEFREVDFGG